MISLTEMPIIIGRNDAGKSSLLYAISLFFDTYKLESSDFHLQGGADDPIQVEIGFGQLSDEAASALGGKRLVSSTGLLVIRRTYERNLKLKSVEAKANDFDNDDFRNLWSRKESALNGIGEKYGIEFTPSGRSITNEGKISSLVRYAESAGIRKNDAWIELDKETLGQVEQFLPDFVPFPSEMSLDTEQAGFQNPFQDMIVTNIESDAALIANIQPRIEQAVKEAVSKIEANLRDQTDSITSLVPKAVFHWKRLVSLEFETIDRSGVRVPLSMRGQGVRRLLMVAFFKYLAETEVKGSRVYAIEEPETFLHPKAQRDLIEAFRRLREAGFQVILTSHSPVFAAEAGPDDLVLVLRDAGSARVVQGDSLEPEMIVDELGILPRDMIAGYSACVFVEGAADKCYLETVGKKFAGAGMISGSLDDLKIGVVTVGGDNLRFFVEKELVLKRLNRRFAVIVDSDRKSPSDVIPGTLVRWKDKCEAEGGFFHILRKRQIENYLHPAAIERVLGKTINVDEYGDIKPLISSNYNWKSHLKPVIEAMSIEEILDMDQYTQDGAVSHEFQSIFDAIARMAEH